MRCLVHTHKRFAKVQMITCPPLENRLARFDIDFLEECIPHIPVTALFVAVPAFHSCKSYFVRLVQRGDRGVIPRDFERVKVGFNAIRTVDFLVLLVRLVVLFVVVVSMACGLLERESAESILTM